MDTQRQELILTQNNIDDFKEYLYERENAAATICKYLTDVRTFYQFLNGRNNISKKMVMEYKEWLMSGYALSSINSMLAALNQFLEFMGVPGMKVKRIKIQKQLFLEHEKELTKIEYEKLCDTARRQNKVQLSLIIETMAVTGARVSELAFFTVERIRNGRIEVLNKGKRRTLLIADGLRKKLLYFAVKYEIKKGGIFITKNGQAKNRSNLWREMKSLDIISGVDGKKIFPHNLRHLFARMYYQLTKDLAGLADLLGHSNMDVTRIYTAETRESFQRQINRMGLLRKE